MKNEIIKIPWFISNRFTKWYMEWKMNRQPNIPGEDEFINSIPTESEVMPSCKPYEEWKSSLITGDLILLFQESRYRKGYDKYIQNYRKELRDWYNKRKKQLKTKENVENN
jgi:hypothetical protein